MSDPEFREAGFEDDAPREVALRFDDPRVAAGFDASPVLLDDLLALLALDDDFAF